MLAGCTQYTQSSENYRGLDSVLEDTATIVAETVHTSASESIELQNALFAINPEDYIDERSDIWDRVRSGFQLQDNIDHPRLMSELNWYSQHDAYLDRVVERAEPFLHYIMSEVEARGLPTELALLPIVESAFQPFAYSHGRAAGIWQFIPSTGKLYGLKQNWWYDGRRDVYASTQAALKYLENLNREFKGDWLHALAAYNSGSGTVQRAIRKNASRNKPTDFWSLDLPKETQAYVPKLLALKRLVDAPHEYDISLRCVEDLPYFEQVDVGSQIDLAMAAEMADLDLETLYELNPGFNRWATDPYGPHTLLIPVDNAVYFKEALAELAPEDRIKWKRHKIAQGETLSHIADRYTVSVDNIKQLNNLRSNSIRVGDHLVIPVASRKLSDYNLTAYQRKRTLQSIQRKGTRVMHYVQSGETFWEISRKYKVNHRELARWNGMAPRDPLKIGQKLVVWTRKPVSSASAMANVTGKAIQSISYRVRNGDSLYGIAQRFRVAVNDLKRWNVLDGKYLQPGQMLKLYVDITEQTGEG
ncbi:MAG TPA: LysM peptidoglycan-binding domain-containing protein [Gammaproteobacteria bacterium]